ncbi:hypothetical protein HC891_16125 [Candidatus Gracilibacteria bacterium]|nr:hypothetical protein [Candidatus Gracilibacteria bacterium]
MTTTMRLLPVRVSANLRSVIDQAGPVNPATRALIILGAATAGWDLRGLEREIAALLSADLAPEVHATLRQVFAQLVTTSTERSLPDPPQIPNHQPAPSEEAVPTDEPPDDPFATIGIDVGCIVWCRDGCCEQPPAHPCHQAPGAYRLW